MATKKPKAVPKTHFPPDAGTLHREGDWLWIPLRSEWRDVSAKPEELAEASRLRTEAAAVRVNAWAAFEAAVYAAETTVIAPVPNPGNEALAQALA
jgi:hypothetical protein